MWDGSPRPLVDQAPISGERARPPLGLAARHKPCTETRQAAVRGPRDAGGELSGSGLRAGPHPRTDCKPAAPPHTRVIVHSSSGSVFVLPSKSLQSLLMHFSDDGKGKSLHESMHAEKKKGSTVPVIHCPLPAVLAQSLQTVADGVVTATPAPHVAQLGRPCRTQSRDAVQVGQKRRSGNQTANKRGHPSAAGSICTGFQDRRAPYEARAPT